MVQFQGFLHDSHENINGDGDPDVSFDCILGGAIKCLDPEMLFDLFDEYGLAPVVKIPLVYA